MTRAFSLILFCLISVAAHAADSTAVFAGGCFWSMERAFESVKGVKSVVSGYAGGKNAKPTYEDHEGHVEAIKVTYDPKVISYKDLLQAYWHNTDPTDGGGQFADQGPSYQPVIFFGNDAEKKMAENSKVELEKSKRFGSKKIMTEIRAASSFYPAEEYHQDFYKKSAERYNSYRTHSGRPEFFKKYWGVEDPGH